MKKNDIIALVFALILVVGVGYYFISQNKPKTTAAAGTSQVEVAPTIASSLDPDDTLNKMSSTYNVQDYKQPVVITGLGNPAPFVSQ
jgi:hypothetical protein